MDKTSSRYCQKCKYRVSDRSYGSICQYIVMTHKRRDCPVGWCDKFEPIEELGKKGARNANTKQR